MLSKPRARALSAEDLAMIGHIARGYPGLSVAQIAKMVAALVPLAAESAAYAKTECDRAMTPEEKENDAAVDAAIIEAVQALGIMIEFGDPRGYTVQLRINAPPNGFRPHNNMGGETWGVRLAAARARRGFRAFGGRGAVMVRIWGCYRGKTELVDTATTWGQALALLREYVMAFGPDWTLWVGKRADKP